MKKKLDGRIVAEIGEERRLKFKIALMKNNIKFTDWLKKRIDEFLESEGK